MAKISILRIQLSAQNEKKCFDSEKDLTNHMNKKHNKIFLKI